MSEYREVGTHLRLVVLYLFEVDQLDDVLYKLNKVELVQCLGWWAHPLLCINAPSLPRLAKQCVLNNLWSQIHPWKNKSFHQDSIFTKYCINMDPVVIVWHMRVKSIHKTTEFYRILVLYGTLRHGPDRYNLILLYSVEILVKFYRRVQQHKQIEVWWHSTCTLY